MFSEERPKTKDSFFRRSRYQAHALHIIWNWYKFNEVQSKNRNSNQQIGKSWQFWRVFQICIRCRRKHVDSLNHLSFNFFFWIFFIASGIITCQIDSSGRDKCIKKSMQDVLQRSVVSMSYDEKSWKCIEKYAHLSIFESADDLRTDGSKFGPLIHLWLIHKRYHLLVVKL